MPFIRWVVDLSESSIRMSLRRADHRSVSFTSDIWSYAINLLALPEALYVVQSCVHCHFFTYYCWPLFKQGYSKKKGSLCSFSIPNHGYGAIEKSLIHYIVPAKALNSSLYALFS